MRGHSCILIGWSEATTHASLFPMHPDTPSTLRISTMQLQSLADELLLAIVDQIDDRATLCNLARTCSKFQLLSEPHIYKSLLVLDGSMVQDVLARAFATRPARLSSIQDLAVRYRLTEEEGIEELEPFLFRMAHLRHLVIEAPCCNDTPWAHDQPWESYGRIDYGKLFEAFLSANASTTPQPLAHLESRESIFLSGQ